MMNDQRGFGFCWGIAGRNCAAKAELDSAAVRTEAPVADRKG
jgi:hypothetical protein